MEAAQQKQCSRRGIRTVPGNLRC